MNPIELLERKLKDLQEERDLFEENCDEYPWMEEVLRKVFKHIKDYERAIAVLKTDRQVRAVLNKKQKNND